MTTVLCGQIRDPKAKSIETVHEWKNVSDSLKKRLNALALQECNATTTVL